MLNLFLILIIIIAFICVMCAVIGSKSRKRIFPAISAICGVFIIALSFGCMIETESDDDGASLTKAYVEVTENQVKKSETAGVKNSEKIKANTKSDDNPDKTVYITRSGTKYHFSYDCSSSDFYECTLEQALERGLEPCSKCVE